MKLPNGFGSVYKLSGKRRNPWVARKTLDWTLDTEKQTCNPVYKFIGYYPTKAAALQALADYNRKPEQNKETERPKKGKAPTFTEVYERWSAIHYERIKSSAPYTAAYSLCSALYSTPLIDIHLAQLQAVIDASNKSQVSLRRVKNLWGLMWDYAVQYEIVPPDRRELVRYVDLSRCTTSKHRTRETFSKAEIAALWENSEDAWVSVVLILIYTGCRISELLELKQADVHLSERYFSIKAAKTAAGVRVVPIADKLAPLFERWSAQNCAHLIHTPQGYIVQYSNFMSRYWSKVMERLNMEHKPHDTRHTFVTLLTEAGVDARVIKQIVGHKGSGVTEQVYTHIDLSKKLEAVNMICY